MHRDDLGVCWASSSGCARRAAKGGVSQPLRVCSRNISGGFLRSGRDFDRSGHDFDRSAPSPRAAQGMLSQHLRACLHSISGCALVASQAGFATFQAALGSAQCVFLEHLRACSGSRSGRAEKAAEGGFWRQLRVCSTHPLRVCLAMISEWVLPAAQGLPRDRPSGTGTIWLLHGIVRLQEFPTQNADKRR
jgi:hypothetical protein